MIENQTPVPRPPNKYSPTRTAIKIVLGTILFAFAVSFLFSASLWGIFPANFPSFCPGMFTPWFIPESMWGGGPFEVCKQNQWNHMGPSDMIIGIYGWDKGGYSTVQSFVLSNGGVITSQEYTPVNPADHPGMPANYDPGGIMTVKFPDRSDSQVESLQIQICNLPHINGVRTAKHLIGNCPFIPDPLPGP